MPILTSNLASSVDVNPVLARTLWQWLGLGALAVLLVPAARGHSTLIGFLPMWLLLAPAVALALLYRDVLTAAWRARLVRATPRRRRRFGSLQATRPLRAAASRTGRSARATPSRLPVPR